MSDKPPDKDNNNATVTLPPSEESKKDVAPPEAQTDTTATAGQPPSATEKVTAEAPADAKIELAITPPPKPACPDPPCPKSPQWWQTYLLGLYLLIVFILLAYLLLKLWVKRDENHEIFLFWGQYHTYMQDEVRLLGIVMVAGALGSFFHAAKSYTAFVGSQRIYISWFWWYFLRPFSGMALAAIFYFVLRGGMLTGQVSSDQISVYGVAAMAGLAGLFSDQAALKLNEVFCNLFKTDDPRSDKLKGGDAATAGNRKPAITSITPPTVKSKTADADVTITGTSFVESSTVNLGGKKVDATFTSSTVLVAHLKDTDIPNPGSFDLIVNNPEPAGSSNAVKLTVTP
ncbi:MAG TPA: IPT/TIG domain-containing protein [Blastocatellia bacterium]|nr:IPT/TIG domain-containing protein [Blastocatellia bacterium]